MLAVYIFAFVGSMIFIVAPIAVLIREIVKIYRGKRWCDAHEGVLIGSDEWAEWCWSNGIKPSYFI